MLFSRGMRTACVLGLLAFFSAPAQADTFKMMGGGIEVSTSAGTKISFVERNSFKTVCKRHHRRCHRVRYAKHLNAKHLNSATVIDARVSGYPMEIHPLLAIAEKDAGRGNFTGWNEAWCRDAINSWARQAGIHLRNTSHTAIDALALGPHVSKPVPGDLAVLGFGRHHHVTIFAGWGGRGFLGFGGNQGHRTQMSSYRRSSVIAFVRIAGL